MSPTLSALQARFRGPARAFVRGILALGLVAYFALGLGYLGLRWWLWPQLDDWRAQIAMEVSSALGVTVRIGQLESGFEGLWPRLTLSDTAIELPDGSRPFVAQRIVAVLSPRLLWSGGEARLSVLQIESPVVRVDWSASQRRLTVAGVALDVDAPSDDTWLRLLSEQRRILLHDARIDWNDLDRGVSQSVSGLDLALGSVGRRHRAVLSLGATPGLWEGMQLGAEIYRPARSRASDWHRWTGEFFVGADGFDLAAVRAVLPVPLPELALERGRGRLRAWLALEEGEVGSTLVRADVQDLVVAEGAVPGLPPLQRVQAEALLKPADTGWQLRLPRLDIELAEGAQLAGQGEQVLAFDPSGALDSLNLSLAPSEAHSLLSIAQRLPWAAAQESVLQHLQASGRLSGVVARWSRRDGIEVSGNFRDLSVRHTPPGVPGPPWFEGLSGELRYSPQGGELRVSGRSARLGFPGLFEEPILPFDELRAVASWRQAETLQVRISELVFANADAAGSLSGQWHSGGKGAGVVDLTGRLQRADARRVARYLPLRLPAGVRDWVSKAVLEGRCDEVRLRLRGDLADFPFRDPREGDFSVQARLADARLAYVPGWPSIERMQGQLAFDRNGMSVAMRSGRVFGVTLANTQAVIRDFDEGMLRIEGGGEGPAQDLVRFVNESPLKTRIDDFTRDVRVSGNAKLQLRLDLALQALERSQVRGSVAFQGNELTVDRSLPVFGDLQGALEFHDAGLRLRNLSARLPGGSLRVNGDTTEAGRLRLQAEGMLSAEGMRQFVDNGLTRALGGSTPWKAEIDVRRRAASVRFESDLVGLTSSLPPPFEKSAETRWPLRIVADPEFPSDAQARSLRDRIRVDLRDSTRLLLERERDPVTQKLRVRRGSLALNADPVLQDNGLSVVLDVPAFDVDAWSALLSSAPVSENAEGFSIEPNFVSVVAREVRVGGKTLHDVVFGASRLSGFWRANVSAREANGYFTWRDPAAGQKVGTLTARFTRLEIPRSRANEVESLLDTSPDTLPALDVAAEEFILSERRLGSLSVRATNGGSAAAPVWKLDELRIANPHATLSAHGSWAPPRPGAAKSTSLDFDLEVGNSGDLLAVFGLRDTVRGGAGKLGGSLQWSGSPMAIDYPSLSGRMNVKVGKGQFLKTDPGIGKLIGVLNLQSLPRRLTLDFRDIFAEGFAFDEIAGEVAVQRGVASTTALTMRGVQAQVVMRGEANLAAETQNLDVEVKPEFNAGLASLAYGAMVNPAIGLGSFLAQLALRGPLQSIFKYHYEITGSWADPQVVERRRTVEPEPVNPQGGLKP